MMGTSISLAFLQIVHAWPPREIYDASTDGWLTSVAVPDTLTELDRQTLLEYDAMFERQRMYCNGRWFGAQLLQDPSDLIVIQDLVYSLQPGLVHFDLAVN